MSKSDSDSDRFTAKPKRRGRFILWGLAGLLLLSALAPNVIGWTGKTNSIVNRLVKVDGELKIGSASLGWLQHIRLKDVQLKDSEGNLILKIDQVSSSKSLLSLAMNSNEVGEFTIDGADLSLVMMRDSSNLEQVLQPLLESDADKNSSAIPQVAIKLINSRVSIRKESETEWTVVEDTNASVSVNPKENKLSFSVQAKPNDAGTLEASGQIVIDFANQSDVLSAAGDLVLQSYNVASLEPVLYRVDPSIALDGQVDSRLKANWKKSGDIELDIEQLRSNRLTVTAADYLGLKPLVLQEVIASGDLHLSGSKIDARQFALKTDFAQLEVEGTFDSSELVQAFSGQGSISHDFQVSGKVDLAVLSKAAPGLVSVRDDIEIQQGLVTYDASSRIENGQRRLFASLDLPSVAAKRFAISQVGGVRHVRKDKFDIIGIATPIRLSAATRQADANAPMWLELFKCESEFLNAQGGTQPNGVGTIRANGDLMKLQRQAEQFLDLTGNNLSGKLDLTCQWGKMTADEYNRPLPNPLFRVGGSCSVVDFVYSQTNMPTIREQKLDLKFGGDYDYQSAEQNTLTSGGISLQSGEDFVSISLAKPIEKPGPDSAFLADVHLQGQLPDWVRRANAFTTIPAMTLEGKVNADAKVLYTPQHVSFQTTRLEATQFFLGYSALNIREQQLQGVIEGKYDFQSEKLISKSSKFTGVNVNLLASDTVIDMAEKPQGDFISSSIDLNTSMQRLMLAIGAADTPCPYRGMATGKIKLTMRDWEVKTVLNGSVDDFQYLSITPATRNGQQAVVTPMWSEKQIALSANTTYDMMKDSVALESVGMRGEGMQVAARGRIDDLTNTCRFDLAGNLGTDVGKLGARLRETFGLDIQFRGNDESSFTVKGPYFAVAQSGGNRQTQTQTVSASAASADDAQFNVRASVGWDGGVIYGLPFGNSKVSTRLTNDRADFDPIRLQLIKGTLSVRPTILFGSDSTSLIIAKERIIDHAQISPEICSEWLKFVAPMLAEATAAKGDFSIDLKQDATLPLTNPLMGTMDCDIILHNAEVGPGPLGREIVQLVDQVGAIIKGKSIGNALTGGINLLSQPNSLPQTLPNAQTQAWLRLPEQTVACRMVNGRVYHRELTFQVKDMVVSTSGSVGADQSIDIVATIPIRKEWIEKNKFAGLAGDSIQIPIRGSLSKPAIGREALQELPKMLIQKAAGNYVEKKAGQFLKDSAGKLIGDNAGDLLKGLQLPVSPNQTNPQNKPLQDAAGNLLEDQLRQGLNRLFEPKKP